jgi:hypothetical protein
VSGAFPLGAVARPGVIHQNTAHHPGADGEKVSAILPPDFLDIDEPKIRLVYQRRGLDRVIRAFVA